MAAGLATLHVLEAEDVIENARTVGAELKHRLVELAGKYELIGDVRGRGLMIGIEFRAPRSSRKLRAHWQALQLARKGLFAQTVVHALFHRHRILTQVSGDHIEVIKLIPPLIIGEREVDRTIAAFDDVLADAHRGGRLTREFASSLLSNARH
jgi:4-aminobutyrate aminotransferase-like enzyme